MEHVCLRGEWFKSFLMLFAIKNMYECEKKVNGAWKYQQEWNERLTLSVQYVPFISFFLFNWIKQFKF